EIRFGDRGTRFTVGRWAEELFEGGGGDGHPSGHGHGAEVARSGPAVHGGGRDAEEVGGLFDAVEDPARVHGCSLGETAASGGRSAAQPAPLRRRVEPFTGRSGRTERQTRRERISAVRKF